VCIISIATSHASRSALDETPPSAVPRRPAKRKGGAWPIHTGALFCMDDRQASTRQWLQDPGPVPPQTWAAPETKIPELPTTSLLAAGHRIQQPGQRRVSASVAGESRSPMARISAARYSLFSTNRRSSCSALSAAHAAYHEVMHHLVQLPSSSRPAGDPSVDVPSGAGQRDYCASKKSTVPDLLMTLMASQVSRRISSQLKRDHADPRQKVLKA